MKVSLMTRFSDIEIGDEDSINKFQSMMHEVGYFGALFVYHSTIPDYWLLAARNLNKDHSFKYIIAIRSYAISPEYCAMMCKTFNLIQEGRLSLNIVAGDIHDKEDSIKDIVDISNSIDTTEKRTEYTSRWLKKFYSLKNFNDKPYLIVSGYSDTSTKNAEEYADEQLLMLSTYKEIMFNKIKCKGVAVSVPVVIAETNLSAYNKLQDLWGTNPMMMQSAAYGTEREVIDYIKSLSKIGVTNVLLSPAIQGEDQILHDMAKKLILEISNASV